MKNISLKKLALGEQSIREAEAQLPRPNIDKKAFQEVVKNFKKYSSVIHGSKGMLEAVREIKDLIEQAEQITLSETEGWFDNVTVSRHMKELKNSYKLFEKTASEMVQLQQRLENCYEDIGNNLGRYWDME